MTGEGVMAQRFSSAAFSGPERIEAFRETYGRQMMKLRIDPLPGHPFELDFLVQGFSGFGIACGHLSPTRNTHTSEMIDDDDVILVIAPQGQGMLRQMGREAVIGDGQATFISNGAPGVFYGAVPSRLMNFRFNRAALAPLTSDIEAVLARPIAQDNSVLRLLVAYARVMSDANALATAVLQHAVAQHMHDLAALLVGATRDGAQTAMSRGVREARLRAVKDDILTHLASPSLSLDDVASRQGISPDYVRKLFALHQTSFTDFVLSERLERAHRMLCNPRLLHRRINTIAFDVGFSDLSYFNRTFRRRYGATPSEIRAAAR